MPNVEYDFIDVTVPTISDSFANRTVSGNFGTASDGNVWTVQAAIGTSGTPSVGGGEGNVYWDGVGSTHTTYTVTLGAVTSDVNSLVRLSFGSLTGGPEFRLIGRFQNTTNYYCARFSSGNQGLQFFKIVAGVNTNVANINTTLKAATFYWLRFIMQGSTYSIRFWKDGTAEPASQLTGTDTSLSAAGKNGMLLSTPGLTPVAGISVDSYGANSDAGAPYPTPLAIIETASYALAPTLTDANTPGTDTITVTAAAPAWPIDGMGVYEGLTAGNPSSGPTSYTPRLQQIAGAGFKLVMNYVILGGTVAQMTAYINIAYSLGLKVIVGVHDPSIWKSPPSYASKYAALYADLGNPSTGILFGQAVVRALSALPGVWGWYVGDEVASSDHTAFAPYAAAIKAADSFNHPRLFIASSSSSNPVWNGASTFFDSCDVIGDDVYTIGYDSAGTMRQASPDVSAAAAGDQTQATAHGLASAIVLQAFSTQQTSPSSICTPFPLAAPYPSRYEIRMQRDRALANMTPRVVLWWAFYEASIRPDFAERMNDVQWGVFGTALAERILVQDTFSRYGEYTLWPQATDQEYWSVVEGTPTLALHNYQGQITGTTTRSSLLLAQTIPVGSRLCMRMGLTHGATGFGGFLFKYQDANNWCRLDVGAGLMQVTKCVAGVQSVVTPASVSIPSLANNTLYLVQAQQPTTTEISITVWVEGSAQPGALNWDGTDPVFATSGRVGVSATLALAADSFWVDSFTAYTPVGAADVAAVRRDGTATALTRDNVVTTTTRDNLATTKARD